MTNAILFDKPAERLTLGRNGYSTACGIQVSRIFSDIMLEPINSKGDITRARVIVPMEHIRELRDALDDLIFADELNNTPEGVLRAMEDDPDDLPDGVAAAWSA